VYHNGYKLVRDNLNRTSEQALHPTNRDDWELYDMEKDRTELNNLIYEKQDIADELIKMYDEWAERIVVCPWEIIQKSRS